MSPSLNASLKGIGVQLGEHPLEGVLRRDPVGQAQKGLEPLVLGFAEINHIRPEIGPTNHRTNGDHDHVREAMPLALRTPRIGQIREVSGN
jgi:hypothetical protein